MKIGRCIVKNFQSYEGLEFNYADQGLALVSGDTGSGKSTLMDAVAWTLFGVTSKDGAADDVLSWDSDDVTSGSAVVALRDTNLVVCRTRGKSKNDLFWLEDGSDKEYRGKDLTDTQRLLETRLGVTAELFLLSSYMTQFSKADSFFIAKAKERREVLEKIADQEFAIKLGKNASEGRKAAKEEKEELDLELSQSVGRRDALKKSIEQLCKSSEQWAKDKKVRLQTIQSKLATFEQDTAAKIAQYKRDFDAWEEKKASSIVNAESNLKALPECRADKDYEQAISGLRGDMAGLSQTICPTCKSPSENKAKEEIREQIDALLEARASNYKILQKKKEYLRDIDTYKSLQNHNKIEENPTNPYGELLAATKAEKDPFTGSLQEAITGHKSAETRCQALEGQVNAKSALIASLTWLYDKSFELRGLLMARVVSQIESATNKYLEKYFDAALRVKFTLADSDKIDVELTNRGYSCNFKSLSGGERTMLKLAFSLSLMRAAQNKAGVAFGQVFLDEPLNGLSSDLKVKAFGLFQELSTEYPTVLVIEHSPEFKAQFDKAYVVDISSGHSEVYEQP